MKRTYIFVTLLVSLFLMLAPNAFSQASQKPETQPEKDKPIQTLQVTWDQFLDDYEPSIKSGIWR